jgi:hypothetical protein
MKKSGLADSPFFTPPTPPSVVAVQPGTQADVFIASGTDKKKLSSNVQTFKRTNERMNERTFERTHERSNVQKPAKRQIKRESFDVYEDQVQAIEELQLRRRRERGKHVTKGEVIRDLLDEILSQKK